MQEYPLRIGAAELSAWRTDGRSLAILDVREAWELDICKIPGSLHIPLGELVARVAEIPKDRPVVAVCHHGMRSLQAVSLLRRNGFAATINLEGGIDAWAREIDPTMGVY